MVVVCICLVFMIERAEFCEGLKWSEVSKRGFGNAVRAALIVRDDRIVRQIAFLAVAIEYC